MVHSLTDKQMKELESNQHVCADLPPVTYRATFKLSKLLEFLKEIQNCKDFKPDDDFRHNICITFVRQELGNNELLYFPKDNSFEKHSQLQNGKKYTQVIPVITGCNAKLNETLTRCEEFHYLRINEKIPFVRSGGEGTGLIPPPPSGGE